MRGFNGKDAEKYEKMGAQAMKKIKRPKLSYKKMFYWSAGVFACHILYQNYKIRENKKTTQVNVFDWKRKYSSQVKWVDAWNKIKKFQFKSSSEATDAYEKLLSQNFTKEIITETFRVSADNPKKQFLLTEHEQHKGNIGIMQLHSLYSYQIVDPNNNLIKRSVKVPFTFLGVPFSAKLKDVMKASYKRSKAEKFIQNKAKFELASECKTINKWNLYLLQKKQGRELLFQCRNRLEALDSRLTSELATISQTYFSAQRQYDQQQKESQMSFRLSDDILK